jgi:hypothetical protein
MLYWFFDVALVFDQGAEDFANYRNWVAVAEEEHCVPIMVRTHTKNRLVQITLLAPADPHTQN